MPEQLEPGARLEQGIAALGLDVGAAPRARMLAYLELLARWNRAYNLTAVREVGAMVTRHLLDSLAVQPYLVGERLLDVGAGAGLPGIPLALADPGRRFVLLDASAKKARFLRQAQIELGLENVEVVCQRVEAYSPSAPFDTVLARAFSTLAQLVTRAGAHCAGDGRILALKGARPTRELDELPAGYGVETVVALTVPGLDAERHLVVIRPERSA